jgi:hypothetical protein
VAFASRSAREAKLYRMVPMVLEKGILLAYRIAGTVILHGIW